MKMLDSETTRLLDKLYNLRGEDSVILKGMEKEKGIAEETKNRTAEEKKELQSKITSLNEEETVLASEGENLLSALRNIKGNDFKYVLEKLDIDFDPEKISDEVNNMLPNIILGSKS